MDHDLSPAARSVREHYAGLFTGSPIAVLGPAPGPVRELVPGLRILSWTPSQGGRIYATVGLWDATQRDGHALEFLLHAPEADDEPHVELLTMVAYYHASGGDYRLGHGHTVRIGRGWLPGSACDHLLVSLPYPWGPELEACTVPGGHARVLWLLPITRAEKELALRDGLEALEDRFEAAGIVPTDPLRACTSVPEEPGHPGC
ncbi:hypothetical protein GCM10010112_20180 [Actinoplanes lobatus]|uniref:Suppressor of fused-like domain-containing protein n=1 Tax=Actinoplanes lobatus TaxID=113568 RepID=A0A7W7MLN8_9ACTN|nr:suppressor of fused domain protein [Actinoplanes lobatus]MBB4754275.1 hypothetical protein [Actinoplanes lobatus]GGN62246.1 hypothetical protein GCM10010112_20180 [Actinoplanes lobatus]GIE46059.1 hypothetical protein Alo02nite_89570 [Actinoplanes lobatus]